MVTHVHWDRDPEGALSSAVRVLCRGGLVAYPTETFYGIGVRALDEKARSRLTISKGRSSEKELPCIGCDRTQLAQIAQVDDPRVSRLADRFWPGPLSLVLPASQAAQRVIGPTVAVRVSGHAVARALAERLGEPIVSTSANVSGAPPMREAELVVKELSEWVDLVLDGGPAPGGSPSTIVELTGPEPQVLRRGPIDEESIRAALRGTGQPSQRRLTSDEPQS